MVDQRTKLILTFFATSILATSCTPTVQVAAPTEPITINLNVKIEHEIRIKVDKELDKLFETHEDIF